MQIADRNNTEHYQWGNVCDGWRLLQLPQLSVTEERVPANSGEVRHFHTNAHQFFYILSGEATIEFDNGAVSFKAGQAIHIPPHTVHKFFNNTNNDVVFLVVSSPNTIHDRTNL